MYSLPKNVRSRTINNINGLSMHILEAGYENTERPTLLLLHGFPELSYSWRKVILPLACAGYHVIAPDQRGYGLTSGWKNNYDGDISEYFITNIVQDVISLLYSLQKKTIQCVIGHDFGSFVAAYCSLLRPDIFKSVILMSAPFSGPPKISNFYEKKGNIHEELKNLIPARKHYQWYFSEKEANDNMLYCSQGLHNFLRAYYHFKSADWKNNKPFKLDTWSASNLEKLPRYYIMDAEMGMAETVEKYMPTKKEINNCEWLSESELSYYTQIYKKTGFQGGLNWYRCMIDNNYLKRLQLYSGLTINIPSYFIAGASDWGIYQKPGSFEEMFESACSNMKKPDLIKGAGHWVQQEKPKETVDNILSFIKNL